MIKKETNPVDLNEQKQSELEMPVWAAITNSGCVVCRVTYQEAIDFSGTLLEGSATIVTNETARRFCSKIDNCYQQAENKEKTIIKERRAKS